ncbi:hypothetical protein [Prauserella endophytica]|nr:hypothetical protein [Prauserella endophytica]
MARHAQAGRELPGAGDRTVAWPRGSFDRADETDLAYRYARRPRQPTVT